MGSHFYDRIDHIGVAFSIVTKMGSHIIHYRIFGSRTVLHIYG